MASERLLFHVLQCLTAIRDSQDIDARTALDRAWTEYENFYRYGEGAALRSDSPVKEPDREHDYRFPDEVVVEAGGSWWGGADKVYAAEYETARYTRILPASTGGERDMDDWRPAWRVVEQAEDGTVTVVELDGEMYQRLPRPQVGDPNDGGE